MKTGHAMPIRAMEDAGRLALPALSTLCSCQLSCLEHLCANMEPVERSQVTDVARQRMHDMNEQEEFKSLEVDQLKGASARHIELQAESKV